MRIEVIAITRPFRVDKHIRHCLPTVAHAFMLYISLQHCWVAPGIAATVSSLSL